MSDARRSFAGSWAMAWTLSFCVLTSTFVVAQDATKAPPKQEAKKDEVKGPAPENPFPNRIKAPKGILEGGTEWLNTSGEITLDDLRGKVVVLDFWTFCCINCMHVLPDLHFLEQKYPNELVVIGVHSAKFDNEKDSDSIRRAIQRYEIEHPVINDSNMVVWRKFGTKAWPTLAVIDPEGYYIGSQSGEGNRELFDNIIGKIVVYHKAKGTLDTTPVRFDLETNRLKPGALRFPGKVLADPGGKRIFVADSNHNRIVVASSTGQLVDVIGSGRIGADDGSYDKASFFRPQGMALVGEELFVADTENHLIRRIDLKGKVVHTHAGIGEQDRRRTRGGALKQTALNSPWALTHHDGVLYVAMAGPHQIWSHKLGSDRIGIYAGSGREDVINGSLSESAFAQPSGMVTDGEYLYVVDSEGSSIRAVPLSRRKAVGTIVGTSELPRGQSLFAFGDKDGVGSKARLQHPLGIALKDETLYVADSYNHKIKRVNLKTAKCETWLGNGKAGNSLEPVRFSEPGGLSILGEVLYVADTNNHRICQVDLKSGKTRVFEISGLKPPAPADTEALASGADQQFTAVEETTLAVTDRVAVQVTVQLPVGYKLTPDAPVTYRVQSTSAAIPKDFQAKNHAAAIENDRLTLEVPVASDTETAKFRVSLTYMYCRDGVGGLCKVATEHWEIPVKFAADAKQKSLELQSQVID